ncbi:MAG: Flp pilus assembly complex ATPase component TadA [Candidatus Omnitrophica bacterium]|nr:Flp pilus assembly complex ATPase component TadA [Candidatus Omnitrophota bacterium]MCM8790450.1 Flp pilus assembly complex ATPase component TadA [Candidatus Omnitrophota bacterium]
MVPGLKEKLAKILLEKNLIKEADFQKAIEVHREKGGSLGDVLVSLGFISKSDLVIAMSEELGIPPINLSRYKIDPSVIKLIPKKIARQYMIIPVSKMGDTLSIAVADPLNIFAIDEIKALTGFKIIPIITTEKDIREAISQYYEEDATSAIEKIVGDMKTGEGGVKLVDETAGYDNGGELAKIAQEAPVVKITNMLLADAVNARASDILIEPLENEVRVRYRVDGVLHEGNRPPKALHNAIVSRLKVMSDLDIAERRLPQDGRFKIKLHGREIDFRISVLPSSMGEKVACRILDKAQATLDIKKLGFDEKSLAEIEKAASRPHGMILMCGPTGCGKTTTLYSILEHVNDPEVNIVTVEDPIEYLIEGANQVTARPDIGLTFASALRSILRQDPDIIMIGEIRDFETVDIAIKAALTGHLVLSTLHTTTATGSVIRLVNMGVEPFLITSSVILVGAQRLVRKICPNCKEAYELDREAASKVGIQIAKGKVVLHRGKGCPSCLGSGYKGRVGLIEILTLSPKIKELILAGAEEFKIREQARREGMKTLRENGLALAINGITTLDEVVRVTVGEQDLDTV